MTIITFNYIQIFILIVFFINSNLLQQTASAKIKKKNKFYLLIKSKNEN
jgi:hypothetical protein